MKTPTGTKPDNFRDHIATADQTGKRIWMYPVQPKGKLYSARSIVAIFLLAILFIIPFIKLNGQPFILLDILNRHFILFGLVFKPQDLYLFVLAVLTIVVFIIQFTAIFGRLFCGWVCPQTIFMEMVFRRIEYLIDGSPAAQRKLREGPWNEVRIIKWITKQSIFFTLSFVICNLFLSYIVGIDELYLIITDPPSEHLGGLFAMLIFTILFYGVFSWFREQACTIVCPYGRLQGVLIDSNSIVVAYDHVRGEPREKQSRDKIRTNAGDCVDCRACITVCPTGIDIRHGTQLECINCSACIDACNDIMRKVNKPEGLIRYTSEDKIEGKGGFRLRGRIIIYTIAIVALVTLLSVLLVTRSDIETTILRTPGTLYFEGENNNIRNLYSVRMVNKTFDEIATKLRLKAPKGGIITMVSDDLLLEAEGIAETAFFIDIPKQQLYTTSIIVQIEVMREDEVMEEITTKFFGPEIKVTNKNR